MYLNQDLRNEDKVQYFKKINQNNNQITDIVLANVS